MSTKPPPKKSKINARHRRASISLSPLQSQGVQTLTSPNMQNKPNHHSAKMRNEPNSTPDEPHYSRFTAHYSLFYENEPNLPPRPPCPMRKTRNEPNFIPRANPNMQNEPNLPHQRHLTTTFSAKRTQSRPAATGPRPKNAKRTQFPPSLSFPRRRESRNSAHDPISRNEPKHVRDTTCPETPILSRPPFRSAQRKDQKAIDKQATSSYHARLAGRIRELFL